MRNRQSSFVIDGEAVLLGVDGRSDFDGLHCRQHDDEVQFYAFDMLVGDGDDHAQAAAQHAQGEPGQAPARRVDGIFLSDFERARSVRTCSGTPA